MSDAKDCCGEDIHVECDCDRPPARETQPGDARRHAVAQAIHGCEREATELGSIAWEELDESEQASYYEQADAVLAVLPPTGDAVEALLTFRRTVTHSDEETRREAEKLVATWRGDAGALREEAAFEQAARWCEERADALLARSKAKGRPRSDAADWVRGCADTIRFNAEKERALAASGGSREKLMQALADARAAYSTGGIEGASGLIKRLFDVFDEVGE